jgi:hypothetical protein
MLEYGESRKICLKKISVRKFKMNWKTLLVIASLTLTAGLTSCKGAEEAPKTETTAPATTAPADSMKPAEAPKTDAKPGDAMKPAEAPKTDAKPGDAMKPAEAPKTDAKPGDAMKPAEAPKTDAKKDVKKAN